MAKTPNGSAKDEPDVPVLPTEQIPMAAPSVPATEQIDPDAAPRSARTVASGGATGLDGTGAYEVGPRENLTVFRRHRLASGIAVGIVAVVCVSGLTAWGVGTAVTASLTSDNAHVAPMTTATPAPVPATGAQSKAGRQAYRATIQNIAGSIWTILTRKGMTVTVTVDGSTRFGTRRPSGTGQSGTKGKSETAASFAVGDSVIVVTTNRHGSTTATRVVHVSDIGAGAGTDGGTGTSDGTMAPMPSPKSAAST